MNVAVIDKHPVFRKGLNHIIHGNFEDVKILEADSVVHFYESFSDQNPDIFIIGVGQHGEERTIKPILMIKKWYPSGNVIVYDEDHKPSLLISEYLKVGVNGYLTKESELDEILDCMKDVAGGKRYLNGDFLIWMLNRFQIGKKRKDIPKIENKLTTRQLEIAKHFADGMKTTSIAKKLGLKTSTVSTIKNIVFKKLSIENILELRDIIRSENL